MTLLRLTIARQMLRAGRLHPVEQILIASIAGAFCVGCWIAMSWRALQ